jgi:hypothetical protein
MYDYLEGMRSDILDYIRDEINTRDYNDRDELEEHLNDVLFAEDSVTGNASGSYTFNRITARDYVTDNTDLCKEALADFCVPAEIIGEKFLSEDWEYFDVTIRCYLLGSAISEVLDEIEDELTFADDEEDAD